MNVGLDNGRGNVKLVVADKRIKYESYCGKARDLDFTYGKEDYHVIINGEGYFVGDLAKREGMSRGFQKQKIDESRTKALVLTGIYLSNHNPYIEVNLVTGTPISDYQNQKKDIEEYLKGSYRIKIQGQEQKQININNVKVFPEGAGAYFSQVLNNEGKAFNSELAAQRVGIVDVGYKTFNLAVFENLKFIDKLSATFNLGMHQAFNMIYKRLSRTDDITPEQAENITTGPEFELLANRIRGEINKFWGTTSFKILLSGGGAYLLKDYFPEFEVVSSPEYANALGYFKITQMLYRPQMERWTFGQ